MSDFNSKMGLNFRKTVNISPNKRITMRLNQYEKSPINEGQNSYNTGNYGLESMHNQ